MVEEEEGALGVEPIGPYLEQEGTDSVPYVIRGVAFLVARGKKKSCSVTFNIIPCKLPFPCGYRRSVWLVTIIMGRVATRGWDSCPWSI